MYAKGNFNLNILLNEIGQRFEIDDISFKPWPSCRAGHAYIVAILHLLRKHGVKAENIGAITLFVGPQSLSKVLYEPLSVKRHPQTAIDAKFSLPFIIASVVAHGAPCLDRFSPQALEDQEVLSLARKIAYVDEPSTE